MKTLILLCLFFSFFFSLLAQNDLISVSQILGGYRFEQNGQVLSPAALLKSMHCDMEAFSIMKKAKSNLDAGNFFSYAGGFLFGWSLGRLVAAGEPNYVLAGIGAGCLAIGVPVSINGQKLALNAVDVFNSNLGGVAFEQGFQLRFGMSTDGVGFSLTF